MLKIAVSTRERAAIAAVMHRAPWLGGRAILNQAALYDALKLGDFLGKDAVALGRTNVIDRTIYDVPDESAEILLRVLTIDGQSCDLALINAGTLRRLDPMLTAASTPVPAPPPEDDVPTPPAEAPPAPPPPPAKNGHHRRKGASPP